LERPPFISIVATSRSNPNAGEGGAPPPIEFERFAFQFRAACQRPCRCLIDRQRLCVARGFLGEWRSGVGHADGFTDLALDIARVCLVMFSIVGEDVDDDSEAVIPTVAA